MKKNLNKMIIALVAAGLLLSGCGGRSDASESYAGAYDRDSAVPMAEEAAYDEEWADNGSYEEYEVETTMEEASSSSTTVTFAEGKKIIYQSSIVMETMTYAETYNRLLELIKKYGGYVEYENYDNELRSFLNDNSGRGKLVISTNDLTIRIPSKNYSDFMQEGLTLGNVLNRNQTIEDKTSEYNTNKSYVDILNDEAEYLDKQLKVLEEELKEAQANDKHYDDIIKNMKDIAERKAEVEKELVPYKRTMDDIDEKVEYSTITLQLREVDEYTIIEKEIVEDTFGTKLVKTWNSAMEDLLDMFQGIVLFLIEAIPAIVFLIIFAGVIVLIVFLIKRGNKKKLEKKLAKQRALAAQKAMANPNVNGNEK